MGRPVGAGEPVSFSISSLHRGTFLQLVVVLSLRGSGWEEGKELTVHGDLSLLLSLARLPGASYSYSIPGALDSSRALCKLVASAHF